MAEDKTGSFKINGNMKKRLMQGGAGVTIIALVSILSPILTGHSERLTTLEVEQGGMSVKVKSLEKIPDKLDNMQKDIRGLEQLMILCNKDNPDLIKFLELNK